MAKSKAAGKTTQKPPRPGKRLGLKKSGGELVKTGQIIIRQLGTKFFPGEGVRMGRDFTLFAMRNGRVKFSQRQGKRIVKVL